MKKRICIAFLFAFVLSFVLQTTVLANGPQPIAQGITVRAAPVYVSDAQGWHQIGTVPAGTPIGIYWFDSNWIKNDPNQWIERRNVRIYGIDKVPETSYGSPLLGTAGQPIQVGETVYAKAGCRRYFGFWEGGYSVLIAEGIRMEVKNRQGEFLFVNLPGNVAGWVKEAQVQRKVAIATNNNANFDWDNVVLVAMPLASHLAGNGRTIAVTVAQAEAAVRVALQGTGVLYTRSDGRILIDVVRNGYRYVGFIDSKTGELGSFFPPAERYQIAGNLQQARNYIANIIQKGDYHRIDPSQVPDWIKDKWLAGASPLQALLALARTTTEVCVVFLIAPQHTLRQFSDPTAEVTN